MTTPIEQAMSQRAVEVADPELRRWLQGELVPAVRRMREIINESTTRLEESHSDDYDWDVAAHGILTIEQGSGDIEIAIASAVDKAKLRPGRHYVLIVHNRTGGDIDITFTTDFWAIPRLALATGDAESWAFVVKESAQAATQTLLQVGASETLT